MHMSRSVTALCTEMYSVVHERYGTIDGVRSRMGETRGGMYVGIRGE